MIFDNCLVCTDTGEAPSTGTGNKNLQFNIINTNARSLCPKINSLIDCMEELPASLAIVTETWLSDGHGLEDDVDDLLNGAGLGICLLYTSPSPRDS